MADGDQSDITTLTVQLLSAYVANNSVASEDLAQLIQSTRDALNGIAAPQEPAAPDYARAVSVSKSLASPDRIISMIDGKAYQTLKRHLSKHGLTPEGYRARYKLPADYPMVAPTYSARRRETAARIGLGRKSAAPAQDASETMPPLPIMETAPEALSVPADEPAKAKAASGPKTRKARTPANPPAGVTAEAASSAPAATPKKGRSAQAEMLDASGNAARAKPASAPKVAKAKLGIRTPKVQTPKAQKSADEAVNRPEAIDDAPVPAPAAGQVKKGRKTAQPKAAPSTRRMRPETAGAESARRKPGRPRKVKAEPIATADIAADARPAADQPSTEE